MYTIQSNPTMTRNETEDRCSFYSPRIACHVSCLTEIRRYLARSRYPRGVTRVQHAWTTGNEVQARARVPGYLGARFGGWWRAWITGSEVERVQASLGLQKAQQDYYQYHHFHPTQNRFSCSLNTEKWRFILDDYIIMMAFFYEIKMVASLYEIIMVAFFTRLIWSRSCTKFIQVAFFFKITKNAYGINMRFFYEIMVAFFYRFNMVSFFQKIKMIAFLCDNNMVAIFTKLHGRVLLHD